VTASERPWQSASRWPRRDDVAPRTSAGGAAKTARGSGANKVASLDISAPATTGDVADRNVHANRIDRLSPVDDVSKASESSAQEAICVKDDTDPPVLAGSVDPHHSTGCASGVQLARRCVRTQGRRLHRSRRRAFPRLIGLEVCVGRPLMVGRISAHIPEAK